MSKTFFAEECCYNRMMLVGCSTATSPYGQAGEHNTSTQTELFQLRLYRQHHPIVNYIHYTIAWKEGFEPSLASAFCQLNYSHIDSPILANRRANSKPRHFLLCMKKSLSYEIYTSPITDL